MSMVITAGSRIHAEIKTAAHYFGGGYLTLVDLNSGDRFDFGHVDSIVLSTDIDSDRALHYSIRVYSSGVESDILLESWEWEADDGRKYIGGKYEPAYITEETKMEVDLDKIKTGDRLVVEGKARVTSAGSIYLDSDYYIRHAYGEPGDLKLIEHKPVIDEPLGIGSLAYIPVITEYAVRVTGGPAPGLNNWYIKSQNTLCTWEELMDLGVSEVFQGPKS